MPYLVMEVQSGRSLAKVLERGSLVPTRAIEITRQILAGVAAAHASGVVHRDLTPDNIMLLDAAKGDFVKVLDFGLAKLLHGRADEKRLTTNGMTLGTPGYMAPEQASGARADERVDIYAVGVLLYEMVAGRAPFVADSPMALLRMHIDDAPLPPRKAAPDAPISAALEAVILRALEKSPARRWPSAEAFARALEATSEGRPHPTQVKSATTESVRSSTSRPTPRFRWVARLALISAVCAGAVLYWSRLSQGDRQQIRQKVVEVAETAKQSLSTDNRQRLQRKMSDAAQTARGVLRFLTAPERVQAILAESKAALPREGGVAAARSSASTQLRR
jgi:serine/threonine-protein kinase